ncbi:hypothetical protein SNE23_09170 [Bacillus sp. RA(2023)]|uniref:hypothetical protein n=1 Tax=Bacillus TaxID=1386 RepID=UPI0012F79255|nr:MULTISPECIES: hypothetical protein [Bacillus]WPU76760.1 hypothetical protein SNE23_09170 [Bacillus sp. RA(2023)]
MKITIGNDIKITTVPDESGLSTEPVYYVYEWFIKETNQVFYIGKGKGQRFKQEKNNPYFLSVKNHYDCDTRFVKENLTEYESLILEESLFSQREKEGHVLTNVIAPNALGANERPDNYEFMKTPVIKVSRVDKYYFKKEDVHYDEIDMGKLLKSHIYKTTFYGIAPLYDDSINGFVNQEKTEDIVKPLIQKVNDFIEKKGGKTYKSPAKSAKSLIFYGQITYESYFTYKTKGYDVYHLVDVLKYIDRY